jgi:hypothetical protein
MLKDGFAYSPNGSIWYMRQGLSGVEIGYLQIGTMFEEVHFATDMASHLECAYVLEEGTHDQPMWSAETRLAEEKLERLLASLDDGHGDRGTMQWLLDHAPLHLQEDVLKAADAFDATVGQRAGELSGRPGVNRHLGRQQLFTMEQARKQLTRESKGEGSVEEEEEPRPTCDEVWLDVTLNVRREVVGFSRDATAGMRAANLARQILAKFDLTPEEHREYQTVKLIEQCAYDAMQITSFDRTLIAPISDKDFTERRRLYRLLTKRAFQVWHAPHVVKIIVTLAFSILFASMATSPVAAWIIQTGCSMIIRALSSSMPGISWVSPVLTKLVSMAVKIALPSGLETEVAMLLGLFWSYYMGWLGGTKERSLED